VGPNVARANVASQRNLAVLPHLLRQVTPVNGRDLLHAKKTPGAPACLMPATNPDLDGVRPPRC